MPEIPVHGLRHPGRHGTGPRCGSRLPITAKRKWPRIRHLFKHLPAPSRPCHRVKRPSPPEVRGTGPRSPVASREYPGAPDVPRLESFTGGPEHRTSGEEVDAGDAAPSPGEPEVRNTLRTESLRRELRNTGTPAVGPGRGLPLSPGAPGDARRRRPAVALAGPGQSGQRRGIAFFGTERPQAGRFGVGLGSAAAPPAATLLAPILACPKSRYRAHRTAWISGPPEFRDSLGVPTVRLSRRSGVPGYWTVRPGGGGPDLRATRPPCRRREGDRVPRDSGGPRLRGGRAIFRLARHTGPPEYSPDTAGFS